MIEVVDNRKKNKQTNYGSLQVGTAFFVGDEDEGLFLKVAEPNEKKNAYTAFSFLDKTLCYFASSDKVTIAECTLVVNN